MARKKRGRAKQNARRAILGLPLKERKSTSDRFSKVIERRQLKKDAKKLQASANVKRKEELLAEQPHSMIVHSGKVGRYVKRLERDLREVLQPYTAMKLTVTKSNNFKDFVVNAPVLGVTHLGCFTKTDDYVNFRLMRVPQGPTLHFRINEYSLSRDIRRQQKRLLIFEQMFGTSPLIVLNGFNDPKKKHLGVVKTMLQNMFPALNIDNVKLGDVRRAVLINYDGETDTIDFRHYSIKTVPSGMTKSTKKIVQGKVPDLSKYEDISEFLLNPGVLSESEWEFEQAEVDLPQDLRTRGCTEGGKTKVRMMEIGPRMTWKLTKIQEGLDDGDILYHAFVQKSEEEVAEIKKRLPLIKGKQKRMEKDNEHRVIRKLTKLEEEKKKEEEEFNSMKQKLIRKQKAVTGDEQDSDAETRRRVDAEQKASNSQKAQVPLDKNKGKFGKKSLGSIQKKKLIKKK